MLQRLGIREKLLAVVAVPILVLVLAAGFITFGSVQDLNSARNAVELIDTLDRARALQANLQEERNASATFVHLIEDTENKLEESYTFTDSALENVEAGLGRIAEAETGDPDEIRSEIDAIIGRQGGEYLVDERQVGLSPATEESGGWVVFPGAEQIAQMQAGYAEAVAEIDALAASLPEDLGLSGPLSALSFRLGAESELATRLFTEPAAFIPAMDSAAEGVDAGIAALEGSIDALGGSEENDAVVEALREGQAAIGDLPQFREDARSLDVGPVALTNFYTGVISTIVSAADDVAVAMADRNLVSAVQAYGDLDALVENMAYEDVVIERLIRAGVFLPGEAAQVRIMTTETNIALAEAQETSDGLQGAAEVPDFGASVGEARGDEASFTSVRSQVLTGLDASLFSARPADWPTQVEEELAVYEPLREEMWERVESRASTNAQNALASTLATTIVAVIVVVVSLVIALVIARRIIGPLRRLTTTATAVRQELPRLVERVAIPGETVDVTEVQIPVESRDEVGLLAEAFNGVNAATLAIAGEQAALRGSISEMFVNVARRDQVLLNRQLSSIDEMERSEDNPETLTKLFALDHLATRMRRNSESLLVLAGIDTGRRLRRPMPLSDVVRTASSEIELYERVQLELDVDPAMLGHSALTAAHLFAELLENATVFSDPGSPVVVRTAERGGDYVVEIEDSGIGMTEQELADANSRVASTAASEILGAQRLGLFVVGRIARRVGAHVELRSQQSEGTLAIVTMPRALFEKAEQAPVHHVSATAVDEAAHAPAALVGHDEAEEIAAPPALPQRSARRADVYAPAAMAAGTTLPDTAEEPTAEPYSIDALLAADAESAPSARPAGPEESTDATSPSGLPSRRQRRAPSPLDSADSDQDRQSMVGLPARATDAQMSALAAEQVGGFMPAIAPAEITPQSPEERSSMFRGFRSRRETEQALGSAPASPETAAEPESPTLAVPGLEPDDREAADPEPASDVGPDAEQPQDGPSGTLVHGGPLDTGAAGAAGGAAGAAAFFSRRERERDDAFMGAFESTPEPEPEPSAHAEPDVPLFRMPKLEVDTPPGSGALGSDPEDQASTPAEVDEFAADPFVVPSLEGDEDEPPAGRWNEEVTPAGYDEVDEAQVPTYEADVADDDAAVDDDVALDDNTAANAEASAWDASAPYGAVDQVSLTEDEGTDAPAASPPVRMPWETDVAAEPAPAGDPEPARGFWSAPEPSPTDEYHSQIAPSAPSEPEFEPEPEPEPAPASAIDADAPASAIATDAVPEFRPASPVESVVRVPDAAPDATDDDELEGAADGPSLDELIQSAVDDDTEQRPGFFSRLFGRGRRDAGAEQPPANAASSSGAEAQAAPWAPTAAPPSAASAAPSVAPQPGVFMPVLDEPAVSPSWRSAPAAEPEAEPEAEPAADGVQDHTEDATAHAYEPEGVPTAFAPRDPEPERVQAPIDATPPAPWLLPGDEGHAETVAPSEQSAAPWAQQDAGTAPEPLPPMPDGAALEAAEAPEDMPQAFEPMDRDEPGADAWDASQADHHSEPSYAASSPSYTPDELARASGWEAAGASALEAAEPEGATTYQPVLQPDSGVNGDADLASAVFSELSSLASQRPKVEKTRAGLQRRRPRDAEPAEVTPLADDASLAPAERDAEAVRHRFSSFYSGTQRARDDVAAFQRQTEAAEASES